MILVILFFSFSGVEVTDIVCNINAGPPTGTTRPPITASTIKEDLDGYFHLDLQVFTNGEAGGVTGMNLWKIKVYLSPDHDGATETAGQYAVASSWDDTGEF